MPEPATKVFFKRKKLISKIGRLFYSGIRYAFSIVTTWLNYDHWSGYNE